MKLILESMTKSRAELLGMLTAANLDVIVHAPTKKRVRDVACHIAQWERNLSAAIEGHVQGGTFAIAPFDIDAVNARILTLHHSRSDEEVLQLLEDTRRQFLAALNTPNLTGDIALPWGKAEPLEHIAHDMHQHEVHHTQQILDACRRA